MPGDLPKAGERIGFIHARQKLDWPRRLIGRGLIVSGGEKHLASGGIGIEHGNANDLRCKRPEAALLENFGAPRGAGGFIGELCAFAEEIFLLGLVKTVQRESGSFYIENKFAHGAGKAKG